MSEEEIKYFSAKPPICACGNLMEFTKAHHYLCERCVLIVSLKARGADFAKPSRGADHFGKHGNQLRFCRL